jgi:hypothetical protein
MAAAVSSVPRLTFFANDGSPLTGGNVYTYAAGTLTPKTFYSDEAQTVPVSNPIVLNAAGRPQASATDATEVNLYYTGSAKFVVNDSGGSTLYTSDNVEEIAVAGGAIAFPVTVTGGTSGAIPYFASTASLAVSALLTAHAPIIGGGAGTAPKTVAAMTTGQLLYGVTGADPAPGKPAVVTVTPSNPSTNATTSYLMMGLGASATITPVVTGRVLFMITGTCGNGTINSLAGLKLAYGTGTAPSNGAAATGTVIGNTLTFSAPTSSNIQSPFCLTAIVTGLTLSTAYWFDAQLAALVSGTATLSAPTCVAYEV